MKVHYSRIYPKKRFKDMVVDHYYDMTAGDFLTDEDCRDQELLHIKSVLMRPLNLPQLPFAPVTGGVFMSKMELYLKIDPDGSLTWIPLCRRPRFNCVYNGQEALDVADLYPFIGCDGVELVYTRIRGVVIMVDEIGRIKYPPQEINPLASKLYAGAPYGDMIYGPAVVFAIRPTPPIGEQDLFPLSKSELSLLSVCLGVPIPEV